MSDVHPYARLTPDLILDAVEDIGFAADGRLLALNSYENRVWQVGIDNHSHIVVKFYRPERWSDGQIAEEHEFVAAMAAAELPVVAPLTVGGATLFRHEGFRYAVYPRQGGRAPEFEDPAVLEWIGRLMARIHLVGERQPFTQRGTLDLDSFGIDSRDWLLENEMIPDELSDVWMGVADEALENIERCYERAGDVALLRLHGDCRIVIGCQTTIVSRKHCH